MASPLLEIPGARRRRALTRVNDRGRARSADTVNFTRAPLALDRRTRRSPRRWYRSWSRRPASRVIRPLLVLLVAAGAVVAWRATFVAIRLVDDQAGLAFPSARVGAEPLRFAVDGGSSVEATLSGIALAGVDRVGDDVTVPLPANLPPGGYGLRLSVDRPFPFGRTERHWAVTIDDQPPAVALAAQPTPVKLREPVVVSGTVEPGASLELVDPSATPSAVRHDPVAGTFEVAFERAPAAAIELVATDAAGNGTRLPIVVPVAYPGDTRAVHISAAGWSAPELRDPVLALVDRGVINAVQLDIKDESGIVGYDSAVPLAREIGAVQPSYDVGEAIATLHGKGVRVIGRIVAFRDPLLTAWAWQHGHRDWVVQDPSGQALSAYGGFANYALQPVRDYNLDLAVEAAQAGFDEILWDYVRRPEGDPATMVVPGLTGTGRTTGDMIVEFLGQGQARLHPLGAYQGASVFGIAATRPENIGQPVDRIAQVVDYVAPMVYPSHYVGGECGVADPARQPYAIVVCSLADFRAVMAGSDAALVPWLQDFSLDGIPYGGAQVAEQVRGALDAGGVGFLLWNPGATYTYGRTP